jgi:hypothetical protein
MEGPTLDSQPVSGKLLDFVVVSEKYVETLVSHTKPRHTLQWQVGLEVISGCVAVSVG